MAQAHPRRDRIVGMGLQINPDISQIIGSVGFERALVEDIISINPLYQHLSLVMPDACPFSLEKEGRILIQNLLNIAYFYSKCRAKRSANSDKTMIQTMAIGELLAYDLPVEYYHVPERALELIRSVIRFVMFFAQRETLCTLNAELYTALPAARTETWLDRAGLPEAFPFTDVQITGFTANQLYKTLIVMAHYSRTNAEQASLDLLVTFVVAMCKRGTVTERFINKIVNGVQTDIGKLPNVSSAVVINVWNSYCQLIPDGRYGEIFREMLTMVPAVAMRLRLTIQQTSGAGLTCLTIILRAMRRYADFNWPLVARILDPEMANVSRAVTQVDDDVYYGFRKDLGDVKSTSYKNLSWVAKQLLVRLNGESTLNQYRGIPRSCKEQDRLDTMIDEYIENRAQRGAEPKEIDTDHVN